jgi:micrococcal nuclease
VFRRAIPAALAIAAVVLSACAASVANDASASAQPTFTDAVASIGPTTKPTVRPTPKPTPRATPKPVFGKSPTGPTQRADVTRVVDGDTIEVAMGGQLFKVRYIGIDTPETVKPGTPVQWMGPEASAANHRLVDGARVVLEKDLSETDRYGRLLRYVWLHDPDGSWRMVNLVLVRKGFAAVSTYPPDVKYTDALFLPAQRAARKAGLGLWGDPPPQPEPISAPPPSGNCDPSYPSVCIPPAPPDLDCGEIGFTNFTVQQPDPHGFDGDGDGIGCES